jgi:hypothetical protein
MCYPKTLLNPLYIQLKQPDSMKQFFLKLGPERQSFVRTQCHIKPYITCYKICNKLHHFQASMDMTQHAEMSIPLNDVNSLLINVSTFNEPRSVNNVQGEPCPCARAHHWSQTLRLHVQHPTTEPHISYSGRSRTRNLEHGEAKPGKR